MEQIFRLAREVNPELYLFYCEYRIKNSVKWDAVFELAQSLKQKKICDGVSIQLHSNSFPPPDYDSIVKRIKQFKKAGFIVYAPEIVCWTRLGDFERPLILSDYVKIAKICVELGVDLIGFWCPLQCHQWHWYGDKKASSWLVDENFTPTDHWNKIADMANPFRREHGILRKD